MYTQAERILSVATPLGDDAVLLAALSGREALSQLFRFELDLAAEEPIDFDKLLGQKVGASVALDSGEKRFFNGIVSRISSGARDDRFFHYRVEVVPQVWILTRRIQSRIFQRLTVPEILKKVLEGFDIAEQLTGTFPQREYCVQYQESDFAFASRLMEEEGIYYFFVHTADAHQMVLANSPQSHPDVPEPSKVMFEEAGGGTRDEDRVSSWTRTQELRSSKYTVWDHCFQLPGKHLEAEKAIVESVQAGGTRYKMVCGNDGLEIYEHPGRYAHWFDGVNKGGGDQASQLDKIFQENKRTAEIRMQQEAVPGLSIRGASNCRQLVAGHKFKLERHETDEGQYVVTEVTHAARQQLANDARIDEAFYYDNSFECIPMALPFRPQRVTPVPRIYGAQAAVVVGPAGEEIFTDKYGRVKVQFYWDREGKNDPDSSCWIRVSQPWAGKGWGSVAVPRIGQEVIVEYVEGDPDRPIITGKVYNHDQMPPYTLPAGAVVSGLKSNSTKGGAGYNEICCDDTKGKEMVRIHAQYDMSTTVEHDDTQHIVTGNRKIDIDAGTHTEKIKGNTSVTVVTGNHSLDVQTGTHTHHVKGKVTENYDNEQATKVANNILIQSLTAKITVDASQEIYLHTGESIIQMKQDGTIKISGKNIDITGDVQTRIGVGNQNMVCDTQKVSTSGAAINSTAVGMHEITGALVKIN